LRRGKVERNILRNRKGVALVIALIMLLLLTFIGISAISTTTFETNISGNERVGTAAFYASEAILQKGFDQLPDTTPIATSIGEDSYAYGWSGHPTDKKSPQSPLYLGLYPKAGFDSSWAFRRYQINATGESFSATKEIEAQVSYGPISSGTQYNN
jgi:type IV pilus assembly protein PilX